MAGDLRGASPTRKIAGAKPAAGFSGCSIKRLNIRSAARESKDDQVVSADTQLHYMPSLALNIEDIVRLPQQESLNSSTTGAIEFPNLVIPGGPSIDGYVFVLVGQQYRAPVDRGSAFLRWQRPCIAAKFHEPFVTNLLQVSMTHEGRAPGRWFLRPIRHREGYVFFIPSSAFERRFPRRGNASPRPSLDERHEMRQRLGLCRDAPPAVHIDSTASPNLQLGPRCSLHFPFYAQGPLDRPRKSAFVSDASSRRATKPPWRPWRCIALQLSALPNTRRALRVFGQRCEGGWP